MISVVFFFAAGERFVTRGGAADDLAAHAIFAWGVRGQVPDGHVAVGEVGRWSRGTRAVSPPSPARGELTVNTT